MSMILEKAGIIPLTGEADALMMRLLCDLTPAGVGIVEKFFGGTVTCTTGTNWNGSRGAVASVMIPYSCLGDLERFVGVVTKGVSDRNVHQMSGRTY